MRDDAADENEEEEAPELTSDSDDDEESPPVKHTKYSPPKIQQPSSTDEVYSKFLNMGRQFVAQLEDARKQELMHHKSAKKFIDFDEMPPPSRSRFPFTPPSKSRERIPQSQEISDVERDSLAMQSSTRKRLQEKFRVFGSKNTSEFTQQQISEWLNGTARADMSKAGDNGDLQTKREMIGGFVRANVSFL